MAGGSLALLAILFFLFFGNNLAIGFKGLAALALFGFIIVPALLYWRNKYPEIPKHYFYKNSLYAYSGPRGRNRGSFVRILPDRISKMVMSQTTFRLQPFNLYTVHFKDVIPGVLPNFSKVRFGIPNSADLTLFFEWMQAHGVQVTSQHASSVG